MKKHTRRLSLMIIVVFVLMMAITVYADSTINSGYYHEINGVIVTQYAPTTLTFQRKYDKTSPHYFYFTENVSSVFVKSYGNATQSSSGAVELTRDVNGNYVGYVVCQPDIQYKIHNGFNEAEHNYSWCGLAFIPGQFSGALYGYWHPDFHGTTYEDA